MSYSWQCGTFCHQVLDGTFMDDLIPPRSKQKHDVISNILARSNEEWSSEHIANISDEQKCAESQVLEKKKSIKLDEDSNKFIVN